MTPDFSATGLRTMVPFDVDGRHFGDLRLVHSDNRYAAGYIPIPLAVLRNGAGPTLLLTGGTHGDEYEGPAAILRLAHDLDLAGLRGRIIALPALNAPAFYAATRVSPIDRRNLNRACPGSLSRLFCSGTVWDSREHIEISSLSQVKCIPKSYMK
jgi:predicted deacylase